MVPDIFPVTFMPPGESKNQAFEKVFNQIEAWKKSNPKVMDMFAEANKGITKSFQTKSEVAVV